MWQSPSDVLRLPIVSRLSGFRSGPVQYGEPMDTHRTSARTGRVLPSLVRWGLSPDADLVYRTLVSLDMAREGQLAHELGMSHDRVREAMRELAGAGAIRRVSATSHRTARTTGRAIWAARQPNQVVGQLHGYRPRQLEAAARDATGDYPGAPARTATQPGPVRPASAVQPTATTPAPPTLTAGPQPIPVSPAQPAPVRTTQATGAQSPAPAPPQSPARIPVQAGPPAREAVPEARPLPTGQQPRRQPAEPEPALEPPAAVALTPRERAIVELLARGHTDETAARELDLSRRTVGYALGGLMSRLGVDNRFQLGLALGAMRAATPVGRENREK